MAAPRHIRKKVVEQKREATREKLLANAEARLPKKKAELYQKIKDGGRTK